MVAKVNWTFKWQRGGAGTLMAASKTAAIMLARTLRHQGQGCLVSTLTRDPYFIVYNSIKPLGHGGSN
jgi:hypothetical protein